MHTDAGSQAEADSVRQALLASYSAKRTPGPKQMLPNGIQVPATPYFGFRYPGEFAARMLGTPEIIMKKEAVKPKHKYAWLSRRDIRTTTKLRSEIARAVTMDEIDKKNPDALVIEIVTPNGSGVLWENMILVEYAPMWAEKLYTDYERWAIAQLAQMHEQFGEEIADATKGAYTGTFEVKDRAQGR